ncbi:hypothetical protein B0H16DRAFT_566485 [Mycena metata]|uniref:Secreted protein n=1 Tax=Mycena metata TaxID=1033252 RepID=A0AAD7MDY4_9AGAR|nr:hypothetical protein B0H16DRAFT_566485 [Mycena metata]
MWLSNSLITFSASASSVVAVRFVFSNRCFNLHLPCSNVVCGKPTTWRTYDECPVLAPLQSMRTHPPAFCGPNAHMRSAMSAHPRPPPGTCPATRPRTPQASRWAFARCSRRYWTRPPRPSPRRPRPHRRPAGSRAPRHSGV